MLTEKNSELYNFISKLRSGGLIVCTGECSLLEIGKDIASGRMFIDEDCFGYIYFPPDYKFEQ